MRDLTLDIPGRNRDRGAEVYAHFGSAGDGTCGAFWTESPIDGQPMRVIASSGCGWEHLSVSRHSRCPNWPEMCHVKALFFDPEEAVVQFHPPRSIYVNCHPHCLHLWRPTDREIHMPPPELVGPS